MGTVPIATHSTDFCSNLITKKQKLYHLLDKIHFSCYEPVHCFSVLVDIGRYNYVVVHLFNQFYIHYIC